VRPRAMNSVAGTAVRRIVRRFTEVVPLSWGQGAAAVRDESDRRDRS
jgi:hypothetical protein